MEYIVKAELFTAIVSLIVTYKLDSKAGELTSYDSFLTFLGRQKRFDIISILSTNKTLVTSVKNALSKSNKDITTQSRLLTKHMVKSSLQLDCYKHIASSIYFDQKKHPQKTNSQSSTI